MNEKLEQAEKARQQAKTKRLTASFMSPIGEEGDRRAWLELQAMSLEDKARVLSSEGCDLLEQSMEIEDETT